MTQNQEINSIQTLVGQISQGNRWIECTGLSGAERAYVTTKVHDSCPSAIWVILPTVKQAERFMDDLRFFTPKQNGPVHYFPPYNILPFKFISYHNETAANRIAVLYRLIEDAAQPVIVTTIDALMQKIIPREVIGQFAELVIKDEELDRDRLIDKLMCGGYIRSSIVEEPGDFSVRGGIVDIFTPLYSNPLRIEFYGDLVDSIRFFSVADQRTIRQENEAVILPAKEIVLNKSHLPQIISRVRMRAGEIGLPVTQVRSIVDHIKNVEVFPGIESLISLIYPQLDSLFDYIADKALIVCIDPEELEKTAIEFEQQVLQNYRAACDAEKLCVEPASLYLQWNQVKKLISERQQLILKTLDVFTPEKPKSHHPFRLKFSIHDNSEIRSTLEHSKSTEHLFKPLANWLEDQKGSGCTGIIVCRTHAQSERIKSLISPYGIQFTTVDGFPELNSNTPSFCLSIGRVSSGFVWKGESLAVITEDEIFGVKPQGKKYRSPTPRSQMLDLQELKRDDFIVHDDHGIGQYDGLAKLTIDGITGDFLTIVYRDGDKLYLPVDRMSLVQKYMGVDGIEPSLDKMGGKSWERLKERVKRSAEKIAGELLNLYARRNVEKGFAFRTGDIDFRDFEAVFEYEETTDQIRAINDTLDDMQQTVPMDRLVCGDVGYGKTEVALRASFLSVNNGKQVAMLVPTTILAEQHYATFRHRFARYPVNLACLSRFRSSSEQRDILAGIKTGKIDIVIGTHRLLQKDVIFKDLGLLVLDEEQRFGVQHKEKLKKLRSTVDVLTLTATPIPRTLHISLMGIRDISVISTPPEYRQSIITYLSGFDDVVIAEAIRKELTRNGQIFFVHNNIHSIENMANQLKQMVPEMRLDIAHARLNEDDLESVMYQFLNKEIDLLLCTSIIESGLDIPSANTIIVNRADRFGLAQIYQLRGRVGRADEQAYAYLLIPSESSLTKDAKKRLKVLMEHSDLGSGFQIAMNDLKIRGGGTILGASQSGHIAAVGYDMFLKLMENAIAELKGDSVPDTSEPEINMSLSAFFPESYISDLDQRLTAYRRLAKMTELKEISEFKSEMIDRYGNLPEAANNLLLKIVLKILAKNAGISRLDLKDRQLMIQFSEALQFHPDGLVDMVMGQPERFEWKPDHRLKIKLNKSAIVGQLLETRNFLKEIAHRVSQ
jgi:transcription-repair coupling factor (superfamily II helicase)